MNVDKQVLKESKKEIILKIITSVFIRAEVLILPIFWAKVITEVTAMHYEEAYKNVLICLGIIVIYWLSEHINQITFYKLYNAIYFKLTEKAINGISHNSLFSLSRFSLSEYLNILNSDIDIIASYYTNLIARILCVLEMFVIYYYFFKVNFYMFFIAAVISIIGVVGFRLLRKKTSINNMNRKKDLDIKTGYNHEFFSGMRDIKAFNLFGKISDRVFNGTNKYLESNAKYNVSFNGDKFFIVCFIDVMKYLMMFYGVYLIGTNRMDVGVLLVIYNYYAKIVENFGIVSTLNVEKCNLNVSKERYNKIFEYASYADDADIAKRKFEGKIEFHDVLYGYKDDPTLKDFSLKIKPNTLTTIIGSYDSGYNGIYELLLKMNRQHSGTIKIDDIDIKNIQNSVYYNTVALVTPTPFFFNLSIKDNLLIVNKDFKEIEKICEELGIYKEIKALPDGFNTIVNENINSELKAMLAIARVLLKKAKIIIISDLLFELDKKNFDLVLAYLKKMSENHTIIILGRELSTCDASDRIVVLDKNKIKEEGTHKALIKKQGFYYKNFYNFSSKKKN